MANLNKEIPDTAKKTLRESKAFISFIKQFMLKHDLFPSSKRAFVAVSGGMDSMALLFILASIRELVGARLLKIEVLHFNHGTREANGLEEGIVKASCKLLGFNCQILEAKNNLKEVSNFEHEAREERFSAFNSLLNEGDILYTAHHLDDSFEWSLLQQMRSSEPITALGMPLVSGSRIKPLLCVTRAQIASFVAKSKIPFKNDPSNSDQRFERNYIRHSIIPSLKKKWPQYLKHYSYRSNSLARSLGLHRNQGSGSLVKFVDQIGGVSLFLPEGSQNFYSFEDEVKTEIKKLSKKERGVLSLQVQKTCEAHERGKKGPLLYSGHVKCYIFPKFLYLLSKEAQERWKEFDESMEIAKKAGDHGMDKGGLHFGGILFFISLRDGQKVPYKEGFKVIKFEKSNCLWAKSYEKIRARGLFLTCYAKSVLPKNS